jgi:dihydroneopterin aldolase
MGKILISGMEFFAFHGHYPEEKLAGNKFSVDLTMWSDTSIAEKSDNLDDAINYQVAYAIVKDVLSNTKSNLLEHIANNILDAIYTEFSSLEKAKVLIKKLHPAMGGQIEFVAVEISRKSRKKV